MAVPVANTGGPYDALLEGDLPQTVNLDGTASDPGDGASIATYLWRLAKPTGSAAALSDPTSGTPSFQADVWGTYALFLVVINNLGQSSASAPREAPDSAFAWIIVVEPTAQLVLPAAGQRNWTELVNRAIAALRTLYSTFVGHTIADHDTVATGAQLNTLVGGGDATGMHTHDDLAAPATVGGLGLVGLAEAPADPSSPKAVLADWVMLSATRETSAIVSASGDIFAFQVPIGGTVKHIRMVFGDGWEGVFQWWKTSEANYEAGSISGSIATFNPAAAGSRLVEQADISAEVTAGQVLVCTMATPIEVPESPTRFVQADIWILRSGQA